MKNYEISKNDMDKNYFHFTKRENLENIEKNGLLPSKGSHAKYIEQTEKVFFVSGLDNLLILFDCWINVYKKVPVVSFVHSVGNKCMKSNRFPKFLIDTYFKMTDKSVLHKRKAYKVFDDILKNGILFNLDLMEGEDFSFADFDEIKRYGNYKKRHLEILGYSKAYSDLDSDKMDEWNMHTFKDRGVNAKKLKLCSINSKNSLADIFEFVVRNTKIDIKNICPILYDYLKSRNMLHLLPEKSHFEKAK